MLVFAFDRDWTVDVNPHPRHDAVPLEWVRHLAHETDHSVYAIGNQTLAEEAAIPGVVDIVGRHSDDWEQWLGEKQPDGYYEQFPLRRERLALIADLHPDADGYIVVDDLDLADVDGWDHYHAWEFVPAVEQGEIGIEVPDAGDPVADGGYPTKGGIIPGDISDLSSFLSDFRNPPAYELTYSENDETKTRLLWRASVNAVRLERPEDRPALQCTPLAPSTDQFIVDFEAIERLSVVDPPPETYTKAAETPSEMATALSRQAKAKPETVRVSSILTLIERDIEDRFAEKRAIKSLRRVAASRPGECTPAIPILESLLEEPELTATADVLQTLRHIGTNSPEDIAPVAEAISSHLESNNVTARREAARCLALIADDSPDDVVEAVGELAQVVVDGADGQEAAIMALSNISREFPGEVEPATDSLGVVALDQSVSDETRVHATAGLGRVVNNSPDAAIGLVDDLVELFDDDNYKIRNNALALVYDIAEIHTDLIEPYVDDIAALLAVKDQYTRINASGALARVAADFPESVHHMTPVFIKLLADDNPRVRENACWLLGTLRVSDARDSLYERAEDDSNQEVQTRAQWALAQLEEMGEQQ
jgi:HEAT repeat protein